MRRFSCGSKPRVSLALLLILSLVLLQQPRFIQGKPVPKSSYRSPKKSKSGTLTRTTTTATTTSSSSSYSGNVNPGSSRSSNTGIDLDDCLLALMQANLNDDLWLTRSEYTLFVPLYSPRRDCFSSASTQQQQQQFDRPSHEMNLLVDAAFNTLACNCSFKNCCVGDNAQVNLSRILQEQQQQQGDTPTFQAEATASTLASFCTISGTAIESACPLEENIPYIVLHDRDDTGGSSIASVPTDPLVNANRLVPVQFSLAIFYHDKDDDDDDDKPPQNVLRLRAVPFLVESLDQLATEIGYDMFSILSSTRIQLPTIVHGFNDYYDDKAIAINKNITGNNENHTDSGSIFLNVFENNDPIATECSTSFSPDETFSTLQQNGTDSAPLLLPNTTRYFCQLVSASVLLLNVTEAVREVFEASLVQAIAEGRLEDTLQRLFPFISIRNEDNPNAEFGLEIVGGGVGATIDDLGHWASMSPSDPPVVKVVETLAPSAVPQSPPNDEATADLNNDKNSTGTIIGVVIAVLFALSACGIGYFFIGTDNKDQDDSSFMEEEDNNDVDLEKANEKDKQVSSNYQTMKREETPVKQTNDDSHDTLGMESQPLSNTIEKKQIVSTPTADEKGATDPLTLPSPVTETHQPSHPEPVDEAVPPASEPHLSDQGTVTMAPTTTKNPEQGDEAPIEPNPYLPSSSMDVTLENEGIPSEFSDSERSTSTSRSGVVYDGVDYGEDDIPLPPSIEVVPVDPVYQGVDYGDDDDYHMFDGGEYWSPEIEPPGSRDAMDKTVDEEQESSGQYEEEVNPDNLESTEPEQDNDGDSNDTIPLGRTRSEHDWAVRNRMGALRIIEE